MSRISSGAGKRITAMLPPAGALLLIVVLLFLILKLASAVTRTSSNPLTIRQDVRPAVRHELAETAQKAIIVDVTVPRGMRFVASRRGKKYYFVESAQAERLVPGNRVYFESAADAERAGYVR